MVKARWIYAFDGPEMGTFRKTSRPCGEYEIEHSPERFFPDHIDGLRKLRLIPGVDIGFREIQREIFDERGDVW